jgi:hypothetical protein
MSELTHLELRKLTNDEAITYASEVQTTIHLFPTLEKSLEKVVTPFGAAVILATSSAVKVDISGLVLSKKERNKVRGDCYLFFRGIVNSAVRSSDVAERQAATLLVSTLKLHDWRMQALPADKFSSKLNATIKAFDSPNLKAAIATIGADKAFAKLVAAHQQYEAADKQCTDARAAHNEVSTSEAIKRVNDEYVKVLLAIDGLILTSDDPLVKDLVARLNVLTEAKKQTIKAKATRAENVKKEAEEKGKDKDKPVEKKSVKKAGKRSVQKQDGVQQLEGEPTAEQLVEQQFVVDQPAAELSAGGPEAETKDVNDMNEIL